MGEGDGFNESYPKREVQKMFPALPGTLKRGVQAKEEAVEREQEDSRPFKPKKGQELREYGSGLYSRKFGTLLKKIRHSTQEITG